MKKKLITTILLFAHIALLIPKVFAASNEISVILDGRYLSFDVAPQIIDGRTMVPIRAIFEAMGASVDWNSDTQTAVCTKDDITVEITLGSKTQVINGKHVEMDTTPVIKNNRTLAPARYVAESFGYSVLWNDQNKKVIITSKKADSITTAPNIPAQIQNIQSYIDNKLYLEAMSLCETIKGSYTLTEDEAESIESLRLTASALYNEYRVVEIINTKYPGRITKDTSVVIKKYGSYYQVIIENWFYEEDGHLELDEYGCKVNSETGEIFDEVG